MVYLPVSDESAQATALQARGGPGHEGPAGDSNIPDVRDGRLGVPKGTPRTVHTLLQISDRTVPKPPTHLLRRHALQQAHIQKAKEKMLRKKPSY
jgi:hypothetical protein